MGEVVNVLVAFAVIVFIVRWATSGSDTPERRSAADTLGFRPKPVTQPMIDTVSHMFPDIPVDNIRYDLLRTGSVEVTSNKILERGFLDAPPLAYYTLYPRDGGNNITSMSSTRRETEAGGSVVSGASSSGKKPVEDLISRFNLHDRISGDTEVATTNDAEMGGKAHWEDTAEKREASLRERKAQMILAARQRLLAQQQKQETVDEKS